jgi:hypothetical protein
MLDSVAQHAALNRILAVTGAYFTAHRRYPSRVRLGASVARDFLGAATSATLPMSLAGQVQMAITADDSLGGYGIALDA